MSNKDEEFTTRALFDLDFEKGIQQSVDYNKGIQDFIQSEIEKDKKSEKEAAKKQDVFNKETKAFAIFETTLSNISDPKLKAQATSYVETMFNKINDVIKPKLPTEIDIDGSKKTLWGKIKNRIKNFTKPFNEKRRLESAISNLASAINKNPETYGWLADLSKNENGYVKLDNISQKYKVSKDLYNSERSRALFSKEKNMRSEQKYATIINEREQKIEAIHQVRDNAAKEIELRMEARDNLGLSNMSSGTDKLAEKAEKMKNMTPQERLAHRMAEMRGTKKQETPKPAKQTTIDTNAMLRHKQQERA